ncbi:hypothetical protein JCM19236_892 [Vibrio sp. JCM 19236]|nr:hypothetical protein JCM19236_892 [Vibrio sp. JCM 19236]
MKSAGIKVVTVPSGDSEADLAARIDAIAEITHREEKAAELKDKLHQQIETLSNQEHSNHPKTIFAMLSEGRPALSQAQGQQLIRSSN